MRRFTVAIAVLTLLALTAGAALAVAPDSTTRSGGLHFTQGPDATVLSDNSLQITGQVAGAGTAATASLSATRTVVTGCINRGSKDQQPSGLQEASGGVSVSAPLDVTRQGRANFSLNTGGVSADRECPDRMVPVVVSVAYTNITLTVTSQTGTVTAFWAGPLTQ